MPATASVMTTMRRRLLRPWVILPVAALIGAGAWFLTRPTDDSAAATTTERTVEATSGTMSRTVSATGTIDAAATDDLSFTSAGTVTAVNVAAGDTVTTGQVLATIDSSEGQQVVLAHLDAPLPSSATDGSSAGTSGSGLPGGAFPGGGRPTG